MPAFPQEQKDSCEMYVTKGRTNGNHFAPEILGLFFFNL